MQIDLNRLGAKCQKGLGKITWGTEYYGLPSILELLMDIPEYCFGG